MLGLKYGDKWIEVGLRTRSLVLISSQHIIVVEHNKLRWGIVVRVRCLLLLSSEFLIDVQNIIINYIPHILQVEKKPD
jgi:hypothetical protein